MNTGFNLKSPAALYMRAQSLSCECLFVTPWTTAHLAPLSMGFSSQEYWSGLPISSSRASSWPRDRTHDSCVSCTGRQIFYHQVTWEAPPAALVPDSKESVCPLKPGTDFSSLAMEVLDGIFFQKKAVLTSLKICCVL